MKNQVCTAKINVLNEWLRMYTCSFCESEHHQIYMHMHMYVHVHVQWNLRITDTLGARVLSFVGRLSLSQRLPLILNFIEYKVFAEVMGKKSTEEQVMD